MPERQRLPDDAAPAALRAEITRLEKVVTALMNRAERDIGGVSDFCMFQNTVTLEKQVHERTQALAAALAENSRITRALKREKAEQQVLIEQLEAAQAQLIQSEKLASLGALVAGIAHELNTPIGNGVVAISTLRKALATFRHDSADGLRRSTLEALLASIDTGSDITQRNLERAAELITSFKQVSADQASSQRRSFELASAIEQILLTLLPTLKQGSITVVTNIPPGLVFDSYPGPLGQIISNLIGNAVMHAFDGRSFGQVAIDASPLDARRIRLRICDNGVGIPADLLPRIFDPFVTSRMGRGGTGLGLHIAHNIAVQVLGGSISASSIVGQGTTFELVVPLVAPLPRSTG